MNVNTIICPNCWAKHYTKICIQISDFQELQEDSLMMLTSS
jgi:hypothetical protein